MGTQLYRSTILYEIGFSLVIIVFTNELGVHIRIILSLQSKNILLDLIFLFICQTRPECESRQLTDSE